MYTEFTGIIPDTITEGEKLLRSFDRTKAVWNAVNPLRPGCRDKKYLKELSDKIIIKTEKRYNYG